MDADNIANIVATLAGGLLGLIGGAFYQSRLEQRQERRDKRRQSLAKAEELLLAIGEFLHAYLISNMRWQTAIEAGKPSEIEFSDSPYIIGRVRQISALCEVYVADISQVSEVYEREQKEILERLKTILSADSENRSKDILHELDLLAKSAQAFSDNAEAIIISAAGRIARPDS